MALGSSYWNLVLGVLLVKVFLLITSTLMISLSRMNVKRVYEEPEALFVKSHGY